MPELCIQCIITKWFMCGAATEPSLQRHYQWWNCVLDVKLLIFFPPQLAQWWRICSWSQRVLLSWSECITMVTLSEHRWVIDLPQNKSFRGTAVIHHKPHEWRDYSQDFPNQGRILNALVYTMSILNEVPPFMHVKFDPLKSAYFTPSLVGETK